MRDRRHAAMLALVGCMLLSAAFAPWPAAPRHWPPHLSSGELLHLLGGRVYCPAGDVPIALDFPSSLDGPADAVLAFSAELPF